VSAFLLGLDLGQANDFTALAVLEKTWPEDNRAGERARYAVRHLERMPLGTPYPGMVARVGERVHALAAREAHLTLVVDQTGVGRPVVDLLRAARLPFRLVPVAITAGQAVTQVEESVGPVTQVGFHVPKRDLVGTLAVLLQSARLRVAQELPEAQLLVQELLNFRVTISPSGRDSYGAGEEWREGAHDDLVLAVALAAWHGEHAPAPPMGALAFGAAKRKQPRLVLSSSRSRP
jgi:hypothetical protein